MCVSCEKSILFVIVDSLYFGESGGGSGFGGSGFGGSGFGGSGLGSGGF